MHRLKSLSQLTSEHYEEELHEYIRVNEEAKTSREEMAKHLECSKSILRELVKFFAERDREENRANPVIERTVGKPPRKPEFKKKQDKTP